MRKMTQAEQKYEASKGVTLAFVATNRQFRLYLLSTDPVTFVSYHKSLKDALNKKDVNVGRSRCLNFLFEYTFVIQYNSGKDNLPPDFLSLYSDEPAPDEKALDEGDIVGLPAT